MNDFLQRLIVARLKAGALRVANEPAVTVGVLTAAANAATVQTWQGYGSAVLIALVRFVVTGPLTEPAPTALRKAAKAKRARPRAKKTAAKKTP